MLPLIYGFLAACTAGILQLALFVVWPNIFSLQTTPLLLFLSVVLLASAEELSRVVFVRQLLTRISDTFSPLLYGALFGVGFAFLEFFLYTFVQHTSSFLLIGIIAVHIFLSWCTFYCLARYTPRTTFLLLVLVHTLYNTSLLWWGQ